jgi:transcriptional regulator with XRE-family HTH domain
MSSDAPDNRFARDHELSQLHEALTEPNDGDFNDASETGSDDGATALLSAITPSMLTPTTQRYVTELLRGGESPTPAVRQKLVEAANRGLRNRRSNHAALPALLAFKRQEANMPVAELAKALQVSPEDIYEMESGRLNARQIDAERIAGWIRTVQADPEVAISALQRVLEISGSARAPQAAGRRRSGQLSDADQRLIDDVAALLGRG